MSTNEPRLSHYTPPFSDDIINSPDLTTHGKHARMKTMILKGRYIAKKKTIREKEFLDLFRLSPPPQLSSLVGAYYLHPPPPPRRSSVVIASYQIPPFGEA